LSRHIEIKPLCYPDMNNKITQENLIVKY